VQWVVRGGAASKEQLMNGVAEHKAVPGLYGFSVQTAPGKTVEELARAGEFPHAKVSVTTLQALLAAGVPVVQSPGRGYHHTGVTQPKLDPVTAAKLSALFTVMPNPAPVPKGN
jgi:predicted TPR repeat methyltransferase